MLGITTEELDMDHGFLLLAVGVGLVIGFQLGMVVMALVADVRPADLL